MQERLADVKRKLDAGRLLSWRGSWLLDHDKPNALEASIAKAYCPPAALEDCSVAVEVLADAGVRNDNYVEKLYRDALDHFTEYSSFAAEWIKLVNIPVPDAADSVELVAWIMVANVLLNLDATLMKG